MSMENAATNMLFERGPWRQARRVEQLMLRTRAAHVQLAAIKMIVQATLIGPARGLSVSTATFCVVRLLGSVALAVVAERAGLRSGRASERVGLFWRALFA